MVKRPHISPLLVLAFGILAVSTASIFIRNAQAYAPSLVIAGYRLGLAALFLAPLTLSTRRTELAGLTRADFGLALLSGVFLAIHFATWISSLEYTTVTSSVVLVTTTPLWVALLSPLILKEPITRPVLVGMILALLGGVVIGLADICNWNNGQMVCLSFSQLAGHQGLWGNFLALAGAWAAAGYVIIGRRLRAGMSLIGYIFIVYGMAALILIAALLLGDYSLVGYPAPAYAWFLLLALIPQLLGHSSFNWALGYLSAAYVSISLLGEPIGSTILAYIFLNEIPGLIELFGAILILAGIFIASRQQA